MTVIKDPTPTYLLIFLLCPLLLSGQQNKYFASTQTEEVSSTDLSFQRCLDKILPFPAGDSNTTKQHIKTCEQLVHKGVAICDDSKLDFVIRQVIFHHSLDEAKAALSLILKARPLAYSGKVQKKLRNAFLLLESKTLIDFGDLDAAMEIYNNLLTSTEQAEDTVHRVQAFYGLGVLYQQKEDFSKAEKNFLQGIQSLTHKATGDELYPKLLLALVELYFQTEQYPKIQPFIEGGKQWASQRGDDQLALQFYLADGKLAIMKPDILEATRISSVITQFEKALEEPTLDKQYKAFQANLLCAQNAKEEAMGIYEYLISAESSLPKTRNWCLLAQETCREMGDFEKAYEYLAKANVLAEHIRHAKVEKQYFYKDQKEKAFHSDRQMAAQMAHLSNDHQQTLFTYAFVLTSGICLLLIYLLRRQKKQFAKETDQQIETKTLLLEEEINRLKAVCEESKSFNRILTHDLRGPLRNIIGFSALARKELAVNSKTSNYLRYVLKGGKSLRQLITDVAIFQQETDKTPEPMEVIDTKNLIKNVIESMDVLLEETGAQILFPDLPAVFSHQPTLFASFKHIIENGIKYNKSITPLIDIQYFRSVDTHFFQFKDNGIGISSTYHEYIFELFNRLNDREFIEGSGLGLNVCQKMLEKLGGKVSILESEEGRGSTFQISFPILEIPEENQKHSQIQNQSQEEEVTSI